MIQISRQQNGAGTIVLLMEGQSVGALVGPGRFMVPASDPPSEDEVAIEAALKAGEAVLTDGVPPSPVDLRTYAKDARDRHEIGGITVSGVPVATDDRSKTLVTGARLRAEKDPSLVTSWAAADGHVYPLTAPMILAVSDAIGAFVAELFETYAAVLADIAGGTIKSVDEIDARFGALDVAF